MAKLSSAKKSRRARTLRLHWHTVALLMNFFLTREGCFCLFCVFGASPKKKKKKKKKNQKKTFKVSGWKKSWPKAWRPYFPNTDHLDLWLNNLRTPPLPLSQIPHIDFGDYQEMIILPPKINLAQVAFFPIFYLYRFRSSRNLLSQC